MKPETFTEPDYARWRILLRQAGFENPNRVILRLVADVIDCEPSTLIMAPSLTPEPEQRHQVDQLIDRLLQGEPLSRVRGLREFWGLDFHLNEATLDPRPDSEMLIETALQFNDLPPCPHVLDLGTGSGCLLLSLLHTWPKSTGLGVDISLKALEAAQKNAKRLFLDNRVTFIKSDWFKAVDGCFDLIVANPPYIAEMDKSRLSHGVLEFDPHMALFGGVDGLVCHQEIAHSVKTHLKTPGYALIEIGYDQKDKATEIYAVAGFTSIQCVTDLAGHDRVLVLKNIQN